MAGLSSWITGECKMTYTHSKDPLILPYHDGSDRALPELCKDVIPTCYLNPLLNNGHVQTAWTAVKDKGPQIHYKRRVFEQEDPAFKGHFAVDFVVEPPPPKSAEAVDGGVEDQGLRDDPTGIGHTTLPPRTTYFTDKQFENIGSDDKKPLLITLHGLSGGSYENYLRYVLEPLVDATPQGKAAGGISGGDWEALVVNSRGCAGSKITTSILYNARATWDVRQVVKWARKTWPNRRLFGVGYSLGANIITNYLGEEGEDCLLSAAVVVSNPWKLEISSLNLKRTWIGSEVYSKTMADHMRNLYRTHEKQINQNRRLSTSHVKNLKYLWEFDRFVQCASWNYPTVGAYYRDASSADAVLGIRIPTLCLHAQDDPIACDEGVPYEEIAENPFIVMCATSGGGHLSWFESGGGRWHRKPTVAFLNALAQNVDFSRIQAPKWLHEEEHGGFRTPFVFAPTRRQLHIARDEQ